MIRFVLSALPFVLTGLAIAIICACCAGKKKTSKEESSLEKAMTIGMLLGLGFGGMLNNVNLWESHFLGLALGPLWGMALAALIYEEKSHTKNNQKKLQKPVDK